ncbi:KAP family NTPase [Pseudomonas gingeri]|uniref:KAP family NTPase n=1 Tax=Pseudomonas gingeri TaxID=117681 RepID=UPI00159FC2BD|nr:KAP family NTPase [Pseudomonas gingeri]NWA08446.1 KAP family NTPase [Pseudomonas gingeri]
MGSVTPTMKMPELLVFAKPFAIGLIGAEVWRVAYYLGSNFALVMEGAYLWMQISGVLAVLFICLMYSYKREAHLAAFQIVSSLRVDLLFALGIGIWANELALPALTIIHVALETADPRWAPAVLLLLCVMLLSPLVQQYRLGTKRTIQQLYFMADEEIIDEKEDVLASQVQAKSFAETILASGAHSGLVFGVDGPWGVGKTSFINLAERHWASAKIRPIVCRFEPLRYASEPDLTDRLIRDLSAAIQREVFAPEFRPAASRYSRLIKGKADVSFLGFKLSMEPSQDTVDELLGDIDEVLRRIGRRVIIVIDDLDRLDTKTINSVLFATRRTFKLSQATYVLCYDTEILSGSQDEGGRAREFLEKFVTVKLSLFVDSSGIRDFLMRDWQREENQLGSIPSDTMINLSSVLNELAKIIDGDLSANYLPLVGNLRKVKRFVNAMLLMQLERSDLARTDFNRGDLINLVLLHLNYPGLFRLIYAEETGGRCGPFSLRRTPGEADFTNSARFSELLKSQPETAVFLLKQLFDVRTLDFPARRDMEESVLAARACFNEESFRNLENYLKLIVRFSTPEPQQTFILYHNAVEQVRKGVSIDSILNSEDFQLKRGQHAHDQFWRVLVNQSFGLTKTAAEDAINTLVGYLPRYSIVSDGGIGLRQRSIYSLLRILDRAGWGRVAGKRLPNSTENIIEIAWRVFGERDYEGVGLLERLVSNDRGVLGWNDLMLFRLCCSADRNVQLNNVYSALIKHECPEAATTGWVDRLALTGMRRLSQKIFELFKSSYIDAGRNFLAEVECTPDEEFLGEVMLKNGESAAVDYDVIVRNISISRSDLKSFVIYQMSNSNPPDGSGVGCGYYDMCGNEDSGGIAKLMGGYLFDFCFNPDVDEDNVFYFFDHCLASLSNSFFMDLEGDGYIASRAGLTKGFDQKVVGAYWAKHREQILRKMEDIKERYVFTSNYTASYHDDLDGVFSVLDELANEVTGEAVNVEHTPLSPV